MEEIYFSWNGPLDGDVSLANLNTFRKPFFAGWQFCMLLGAYIVYNHDYCEERPLATPYEAEGNGLMGRRKTTSLYQNLLNDFEIFILSSSSCIAALSPIWNATLNPNSIAKMSAINYISRNHSLGVLDEGDKVEFGKLSLYRYGEIVGRVEGRDGKAIVIVGKCQAQEGTLVPVTVETKSGRFQGEELHPGDEFEVTEPTIFSQKAHAYMKKTNIAIVEPINPELPEVNQEEFDQIRSLTGWDEDEPCNLG
ncbi:MAG: hypothetical protein ABIE74_05095 [Pseudomonadota bacterium]